MTQTDTPDDSIGDEAREALEWIREHDDDLGAIAERILQEEDSDAEEVSAS